MCREVQEQRLTKVIKTRGRGRGRESQVEDKR
jgi:hypothetical protein